MRKQISTVALCAAAVVAFSSSGRVALADGNWPCMDPVPTLSPGTEQCVNIVPSGSAGATGFTQTYGSSTSCCAGFQVLPCDCGGAWVQCGGWMLQSIPGRVGLTCGSPDSCMSGGTCSPMACTYGGPPLAAGTPCGSVKAGSCTQKGTCDGQSPTCALKPAAAGSACDDGNACTYGDTCQRTSFTDPSMTCLGTTVTCTNDACETRTCNGTAQCAEAPKVPACRSLGPAAAPLQVGTIASVCNPGGHPAVAGSACDDGNACSYGDKCDGKGNCGGTAITCASDACETRSCNGTARCTETPKACKSGGVPGMCSSGACAPILMTATDASGKHLAVPKALPLVTRPALPPPAR